MKSARASSFVHDLDCLYQVGVLGGLSDFELLGYFTNQPGDAAERAFEAMVHRHGPMVLGVCRRVLGDDEGAEDAFQATFLVLALKAGTIRKHGSLGPWLHGVAARISRRARTLVGRRRERPLDTDGGNAFATETAESAIEAAELRTVLDEEIGRLPSAYRRAVVLCYLEGKTQEDAARELGWSKGTVSGRLARAKDLLRAQLTRRGVAHSAGIPLAAHAGEAASVAIPASLANGAVRTALSVILGRGEATAVSTSAVALARASLRAMLLGKLKAVSVFLLVLTAVVTAVAHPLLRLEAPGRDRAGEKRRGPRPQPVAATKAPWPFEPKLPEHARLRLGTTRLRHEGYVSNVLFAPDGKTVISTGSDGARFWDLNTGAPVPGPRILADPGEVTDLAYSPDGTKLAIGDSHGLVQLWDLDAGKELVHSPAHKSRVLEMAFSPDGQTLATSSPEDPVVHVWNVASGREQRTLQFDVQIAFRGLPLAFAPDSNHLAIGASLVAGRKQVIGVWNLQTAGARPVLIENVHTHNLNSVAFTRDGRTLISGGCNRRPIGWRGVIDGKLELTPEIRLWDPATGRMQGALHLGDVTGMCATTLSHDGKTLVSIHSDRLIVWDVPSWKLTRTIGVELRDPGVGIGGCLALSPDSRTIAAVRSDHTVHLWDRATGKTRFPQDGAHEARVCTMAIAPDGRLIVTGDDRGTIQLWDAVRGEHARRIDMGERGSVQSLRFAPDGRTLAAAARYYDPKATAFRGLVRLWEMPVGTIRREFRSESDAVQLAFSSDGRLVAIGLLENSNNPRQGRRAFGDDDGFQVFEVATGRKRIGLRGQRGPIYAMTFGRDGKTLVTNEADARFRIWDLASGRVDREFPIDGHRQGAKARRPGSRTHISAAVIAPDLSTAVTAASFDDQLLVWDLRTGRIRRTLQVETYQEAVLAVSPDGRFLSGALSPLGQERRDSSIRIWDLVTKREVLRLEPKARGVHSLAFAPDGKTLVSSLSDTTVIIWDSSAAYKGLE